jgi:hypothetical protein
MGNYDKAIQGLQEVLDETSQLELDPQTKARVARLLETAVFNTHTAAIASPSQADIGVGLVMQMHKYSLLAGSLDPEGEYRSDSLKQS